MDGNHHPLNTRFHPTRCPHYPGGPTKWLGAADKGYGHHQPLNTRFHPEVYIPQMVQVYFPETIPGLPVFFPDFFPVQPTFYIKEYNF